MIGADFLVISPVVACTDVPNEVPSPVVRGGMSLPRDLQPPASYAIPQIGFLPSPDSTVLAPACTRKDQSPQWSATQAERLDDRSTRGALLADRIQDFIQEALTR